VSDILHLDENVDLMPTFAGWERLFYDGGGLLFIRFSTSSRPAKLAEIAHGKELSGYRLSKVNVSVHRVLSSISEFLEW